ncbi:hydantoinase/oxoprolinase family protein, partial [Methanosalsum natronophilum]
MEYKLGIDAGGTYTDAVIIDSYGEIVQKNKTKTTYPKLIDGIKHTFDCLNNEFISQLNNITVSTTLSTNTVLEKNGYPVAVILIGDYNISDKSEFDFYTVINGGHDSLGREINSLDVQSADEFILKTKNKVAAFAISSYFSVRNPSH